MLTVLVIVRAIFEQSVRVLRESESSDLRLGAFFSQDTQSFRILAKGAVAKMDQLLQKLDCLERVSDSEPCDWPAKRKEWDASWSTLGAHYVNTHNPLLASCSVPISRNLCFFLSQTERDRKR